VPEDPVVRGERGSLFVVCDGIGGLSAGGQASRLALRTFMHAYYALPYDTCDRLLRKAAEQANTTVFEANRGRRGAARMGTTLVAAAIIGRELWAVNIGDSRCYVWRAGRLDQLTHDHAPTAQRSNDHRITRALGAEHIINSDRFGPVRLTTGDCLLLCTDGLSRAVPNEVIARILGEFAVQSAARQLLLQTQTAGARDNVSILVVNIAETPSTAKIPARWRAGLRSAFTQVATAKTNPWQVIITGRWRTRQGLAVLLMWTFLVLLLGLVIGWFATFNR
jgi:protein phosphatase